MGLQVLVTKINFVFALALYLSSRMLCGFVKILFLYFEVIPPWGNVSP